MLCPPPLPVVKLCLVVHWQCPFNMLRFKMTVLVAIMIRAHHTVITGNHLYFDSVWEYTHNVHFGLLALLIQALRARRKKECAIAHIVL